MVIWISGLVKSRYKFNTTHFHLQNTFEHQTMWGADLPLLATTLKLHDRLITVPTCGHVKTSNDYFSGPLNLARWFRMQMLKSSPTFWLINYALFYCFINYGPTTWRCTSRNNIYDLMTLYLMTFSHFLVCLTPISNLIVIIK